MPGTQTSFDGNWRCGFHDRNPYAHPDSVKELRYDGPQRSKIDLMFEHEMLKFERRPDETRSEYHARLRGEMQKMGGMSAAMQPMGRAAREQRREAERQLQIAAEVAALAEQLHEDGRVPGADDDK